MADLTERERERERERDREREREREMGEWEREGGRERGEREGRERERERCIHLATKTAIKRGDCVQSRTDTRGSMKRCGPLRNLNRLPNIRTSSISFLYPPQIETHKEVTNERFLISTRHTHTHTNCFLER